MCCRKIMVSDIDGDMVFLMLGCSCRYKDCGQLMHQYSSYDGFGRKFNHTKVMDSHSGFISRRTLTHQNMVSGHVVLGLHFSWPSIEAENSLKHGSDASKCALVTLRNKLESWQR